MSEFARSVLPISIADEMRESYLAYAMSVIVGRALPDIRDGLKPVHRRVLYAMSELGLEWNKAHKKSARVVGDVIGKYHPHGESAVYDTIVRMAQPFSLRYLLVDGQGNFGSVDGDPAAAMRYTEVRMSKLASELLADIDKNTVDFIPNYDGSEHEPTVLPTRVPNLLVNGSSGIAVGMATNIPPHNLGEVIDACLALLANPELTCLDLMQFVPGPDFPTAGILCGTAGVREGYLTGRGRAVVRARTAFEGKGDEVERIIVSELPYQVNKARLLTHIAQLIKEKKLEGIRDLRDESDKDGMRVVIELKRDCNPDVLLNNLFEHTQLQSVFGINMVALVDGQPRTLDLRTFIECFLKHRREVVTRRTLFDLEKARARAHKLEGLAVALANIDEVVELIKTSSGPAEARERLLARPWPGGIVVELLARAGADASRPRDLPPELGLGPDGYFLSEIQAQEILDMRLQRLTGLEKDKITNEYGELLETIADLLDILARPERLVQVIGEELTAIREGFADARRTTIEEDYSSLSREDLITPQEMVVTLTNAGYAKALPLEEYRAQKRGGRGASAAGLREEDFIRRIFQAHTHDTLLCFSSTGRMYRLKVYELPQVARTARGRPLQNLLPLSDGERITAVLPVKTLEDEGHFVLMATAQGTVKKCPLTAFRNVNASGIRALNLREGDYLVGVALTDGARNVMLFASNGKAVAFAEEHELRPMGRDATGVRGMRLAEGDHIVSLVVPEQGETILTATENGYGKRTEAAEFPLHRRGGQGVKAIQTSLRNGSLIGAVAVREGDHLMLISDQGTLVRTTVESVSLLSRNTQGVKLIRVAEDERLISVARVLDEDDDAEPEQGAAPAPVSPSADDAANPEQTRASADGADTDVDDEAPDAADDGDADNGDESGPTED
jgi:DNA gyrase subunit A